MKITTGFVAGLLVSLFASGGAHATVCSTPLGKVDGLLSLSPEVVGVDTTNVSCLGGLSAPFGWNNSSILVPPEPPLDEVFTTSANLTSTGIEITMYTGATGGFTSDLVWILTLLDGRLFESITLDEENSDFVFDIHSWFKDGTISCTGEGTSSAVCTILAAGENNPDDEDQFNAYAIATNFTGIFNIEVSPANPVPEPSGWVATLTCLGMLAVVRRRTSKLRRYPEDAMSRTRASKVLS